MPGADLDTRDSRGVTPILHAAMSGAIPAMEVLIRAGADPNAKARGRSGDGGGGGGGGGRGDGGSGGGGSGSGGDGGSSSELVIAASGQSGWSPVTWAARRGQLGALQLLLRAGADADLVGGGKGTTPMMHAALGGHLVGSTGYTGRVWVHWLHW